MFAKWVSTLVYICHCLEFHVWQNIYLALPSKEEEQVAAQFPYPEDVTHQGIPLLAKGVHSE